MDPDQMLTIWFDQAKKFLKWQKIKFENGPKRSRIYDKKNNYKNSFY